MDARVAVVTGSNKGIGLETVRSLCRHLGENGIVYLTARDEGRGLAAMEILKKEGLTPRFHKLDITDQGSIEKFRDYLQKTHNGIDILINNAGIGSQKISTWTAFERAVHPIRTNFFGFLDVCHALMPLIQSGGRVVNLSSTTANLTFSGFSEELKARWRRASTEEDVVDLINEFIEKIKAGDTERDWRSEFGYSIAKLGVVLLSRIYARDIAEDKSRTNILINSCCPGFVKTDMSGTMADNYFGGEKVHVSKGADTPVFLALLPPDAKEPQGRFLLRRQVYDFVDTDMFIQI